MEISEVAIHSGYPQQNTQELHVDAHIQRNNRSDKVVISQWPTASTREDDEYLSNVPCHRNAVSYVYATQVSCCFATKWAPCAASILRRDTLQSKLRRAKSKEGVKNFQGISKDTKQE